MRVKIFSAKEFCRLSGVPIRTLRRWRLDGKIQPVHKNFYSEIQLEQFRVIIPLFDDFNVADVKFFDIPDNDTAEKNGAMVSTDEVKNMTEYNKIQIYPTKELVICIDKMKKNICNPLKKSKKRKIIEDKRSKTKTPLKINFSSDVEDVTAYDELILDVCISEQFKGNEYTTPAIIHRALGGSKTKLTTKDKDKILQSVRKLATTFIDFDITDVCKKFGYNDGKEYKYSGAILPCEYVTATINGWTDSAVIHFLRKTPLLDVATFKGQIATCDISLLDVPKIRNTDTILAIKGYLLRRILQIKGSHNPHKKHFCGKNKEGKLNFRTAKKLEKIILFETLFQNCELSDADRRRKVEYRNSISKILDHFKEKGVITEWHFVKKDGAYYSIHFDFK